MRNMILAVCLAAAAVGHGGSTTVYRDASGRVTATTVVDGNGKTTWRDGHSCRGIVLLLLTFAGCCVYNL